MDVNAAWNRARSAPDCSSSSTRKQGKRAQIGPYRHFENEDAEGVELDVHHGSMSSPGVEPASPMSSSSPPPQRRLGGFIASRYYTERAIQRDQERQRLRLKEAEPKYIEKVLADQRARIRSRAASRTKKGLPSPVRAVRRFLRDPVTRFWLVCNLFCAVLVFVSFFLLMNVLYPLALRPILKY